MEWVFAAIVAFIFYYRSTKTYHTSKLWYALQHTAGPYSRTAPAYKAIKKHRHVLHSKDVTDEEIYNVILGIMKPSEQFELEQFQNWAIKARTWGSDDEPQRASLSDSELFGTYLDVVEGMGKLEKNMNL